MAPSAASTIEIVEVTAAEVEAAAEAAAVAPAGNGMGEAEAQPAWVAGGTVALPQPAAVQTVTQKPANPRRGWWQRLIQP